MASPRSALIERATELAALDDLLRKGSGCAVVVGPAGIGKTRLVNEALDNLPESVSVHIARSSPLEQVLSGGVILQLLSATVAGADDRVFDGAAQGARALFEPSGRALPEGAALFHALHSLCVNLSRNHPLVLVVDDVQWADQSSLEFLAYLMRRVTDAQITVILTFRTGESEPRHRLIMDVGDLPDVQLVEPAALSQAGAGQVVSTLLPGVAPEHVEQWWSQSGGVPLFLLELAQHHQMDNSVSAPTSIIRLVQGRLDRLPQDARAVAASLSVLGTSAQTAEIAELAGLDLATVLGQLDNLARIELIGTDSLTFTHPIFSEAVLASVPRGELTLLRMGAARILYRNAPRRAAAQLAALDPSIHTGEEWAAGALYAASSNALERGGVDEALEYLQRALNEPANNSLRFKIRLDAGRLKAQLRDFDALKDFDQATSLASSPLDRARTALSHGEALFHFGDLEQCSRVCLAAVAELGDGQRELALQLHSMAFNADGVTGSRRDRPAAFASDVAGARTPGERAVLTHVVADAAARGSWPAHRVRAVGLQALADGELLSEVGAASPTYIFCGTALAWADEFDAVIKLTERGMEIGERRGSRMAIAYSSALHAGALLRSGRLKDAEQSAARVVDALADADPLSYGISVAWLIQALVEQGRVTEARAALDSSGLGGPLPPLGTVAFLLLARGHLLLAEGDVDAAAQEFTDVGQIAQTSEYLNPAAMAWRSGLALAQHQLGYHDEALQAASTEVSLAREFGAGRAMSIALYAQAVCTEPPDAREAVLEESITEAKRAGAQLEAARALVELGRTRAVANQPSARAALDEAMDVADQCGAIPLGNAAHDLIVKAGGRPRRRRNRGLGSLTHQERRVAELAAAGRLNREIADQLFISIGTVETHLTNAYRKLGVRSRAQLTDLHQTTSMRGAAPRAS